MKCGYVSIVGRPNVGKSSLLNKILGMKLAITSNVSGTTRNIIEGIYNDDDSQIIFIDTPGIHKPKYKLSTIMNNKSYEATSGVDLILFIIDASTGFGKGDKFILDKIKDSNTNVFLILNKIDKIKDKKTILKIIEETKELYQFKEIIPISTKNGNNINDLINTIKIYLNEEDKIYSEDEITLSSTSFLAAEIVREKLLRLTYDEIPHSIATYCESYEDIGRKINISIVIVIDKENIKGMIIGRGGKLLKEVGIKAREDIEKIVGKKVNLTTYVKTIKNWKDEEKHLKELGLKDI